MTNYKIIRKEYNSLEDFSRALDTDFNNWKFGNSATETGAERLEFTTTKTYTEADELMLTGDKKNAARIKSTMIKIQQQPTTTRTAYTRGMFGCCPIIPAYLTNSPKAMLQAVRTPRQTKVIKLYVNTAVSCNTKAEDIITVGARLLTAVREIEKKGIRIELYVGCIDRLHTEAFYIFVLIKKAGSPLNVLRAAYPLINPSFVRRHIFRQMEVSKEVTESSGSYGKIVLKPKEDCNIITPGAYLNVQELVDFDYSVQHIVDMIIQA